MRPPTKARWPVIESLATQCRASASAPFLSSKILNQHLERLAIVYVRQSSTKQVQEISSQRSYNIDSSIAQRRWVGRGSESRSSIRI